MTYRRKVKYINSFGPPMTSMQAFNPLASQILKIFNFKGVSLQLNKQLRIQLHTYTNHIRVNLIKHIITYI